MTYEERVRSIAEEMAHKTFSERHVNDGEKFSDQDPHFQDYFIRRVEPAARIAVKHMAEMYRAGFIRFLENSKHTAACERICGREMRELGLVPDKEDGNND